MANFWLLIVFLLNYVASDCEYCDDAWADSFRKDHIRFHFFTNASQTSEGYQISKDFQVEDILASGLNRELPTKVVIPGWNSGVTNPIIQLLKDAYISSNSGKRMVNVIIVDWSDLSYIPIGNIDGVGRRTAELIDFLVENDVLHMEQLHIVGMSQSAHIAGVAGERTSRGRVARITGLDPSRPFINMKKTRGRLSCDDAELVDVIHTNAGTLAEQAAIGHVDFYPNGGKKQPGCENEFIGSCSHERAVYLFVESIKNPDAFQAWRCVDEWAALHQRCEPSGVFATMGEHLSYGVNGSYFLTTSGSSPFHSCC